MAFDSLSDSDRRLVLIDEKVFKENINEQQRILRKRDKKLKVPAGLDFETDQKLQNLMVDRLAQIFTIDSVGINEVRKAFEHILIFQPKFDPRFTLPSDSMNGQLENHVFKLARNFGEAMAFSALSLKANDLHQSKLFIEVALRSWIEAYLSIANVTGNHRLFLRLSQSNLSILAAMGLLAGGAGFELKNDSLLAVGFVLSLVSVLHVGIEHYKNETPESIELTQLPRKPIFIWSALKRKYLRRETELLMARFWSVAVHAVFQKEQGESLQVPLLSKDQFETKEWIELNERWALSALDKLTSKNTEFSVRTLCEKMLNSIQ